MNIQGIFPSRFLKVQDIPNGKVAAVIEGVSLERFDNGEQKAVLAFVGQSRRLVLNRTNAAILSGLYGPETDEWVGKPVRLLVADVEYKGQTVQSIRIDTQRLTPKVQPPAGKPTTGFAPVTDMQDDPIPF